MLEKYPISWFLIGMVIIVGLVSVIATVAASIIGGGIALIVLGIGVAVLIESNVGKPMRALAEHAAKLDDDLEKSAPDTLSSAEIGGMGVELSTISKGLQQFTESFQRRITELDSLHAISQTITSSTLDYEKTVKSVLAAVQRVVDYDAAEVGVLHGTNLIVEAWWGKEGFKDTTTRRYRMGKGPTGTIAATKEPLFLPTIQASVADLQRTIGYQSVESELIAKSTKLIINSFLGIPLLIGDRLIGTLTLVHHEAGFFTEDDMRQLNKLADHASIAIDNALKVRSREEELQKQIQELKIEIDQHKVSAQVEEVTGSDFFKNLQDNAAKMRERQNSLRDRKTDESEEETNTADSEDKAQQ